MATKRIDIMDIRQLLQLKNKGLSNRKAAKTIGLHRNSVNHYVRLFIASGQSYASLLLNSDQALLELFPTPSTMDKNTSSNILKDMDTLNSMSILIGG